MFRKYVGLDVLDVLIHVGVTIAGAVLLASMTTPADEIGVATAFGVSLVVLAWRRKRALAAGADFTTGEVQAERILDLEARVAELEQGQGRMLELEERMDFTERLLTRQRDAGRLSVGPED